MSVWEPWRAVGLHQMCPCPGSGTGRQQEAEKRLKPAPCLPWHLPLPPAWADSLGSSCQHVACGDTEVLTQPTDHLLKTEGHHFEITKKASGKIFQEKTAAATVQCRYVYVLRGNRETSLCQKCPLLPTATSLLAFIVHFWFYKFSFKCIDSYSVCVLP